MSRTYLCLDVNSLLYRAGPECVFVLVLFALALLVWLLAGLVVKPLSFR